MGIWAENDIDIVLYWKRCIILFHKIYPDLMLSFPSLTLLPSMEPNPQSSFYFVCKAEWWGSYNRQATRNIIQGYIFHTVNDVKKFERS